MKNFGNVAIRRDHVLQGCKSCNHKSTAWLPEIRKMALYLETFFF